MCAYRDKLRQPLSNIRRWITDFGLQGHSPIGSSIGGNQTEAPPLLPEGSSEDPAPERSSLIISSPSGNDNDNINPPPLQSPRMAESQQGQGTVELDNMKQSLDSNKACSNISKAQLKEFRDAFGFFDKDGDGFITTEELGIVMRSLGQFASEEELKEMLKEVDINKDGLFSLDEFVEIVSNYSEANSGGNTDEEQELRDAFRIFDKHSRGFISASDLRAVLHCLGEDLSEDEIEDMIKEVDVDGDGRIDFNEFVRALGEPDESEEDSEIRTSIENTG